MKIFGRGDLGPVARFSIALAAILAVTALLVGVVTSFLLDRYIQDEPARFTKDAVASHFGPVFKDDVFERYDTTLQALSNALDVRDSETEGHSRRVVEYMELIIGQLSVPAEHLAML